MSTASIVLEALKDVAADSPKVSSLRLIFKKLGPVEAQWIADALRQNSHLKVVRLDNNRLGDRGTQLICQALKANASVVELSLASNEIADEGFCAVADLLRSNATIRTVKLNFNYLGSRGSVALADALRSNCALQSLNISGRWIPPEGVAAIASSLAVNRCLSSLHLSGTSCGNAGAVAFADVFKDNDSLRVLNLSDCGIDEHGLVALTAGLKAGVDRTNLKTIDLSHNEISVVLQEKIPKLLDLIQNARRVKTEGPDPKMATTRMLLRNMMDERPLGFDAVTPAVPPSVPAGALVPRAPVLVPTKRGDDESPRQPLTLPAAVAARLGSASADSAGIMRRSQSQTQASGRSPTTREPSGLPHLARANSASSIYSSSSTSSSSSSGSSFSTISLETLEISGSPRMLTTRSSPRADLSARTPFLSSRSERSPRPPWSARSPRSNDSSPGVSPRTALSRDRFYNPGNISPGSSDDDRRMPAFLADDIPVDRRGSLEFFAAL